MALHSPALEGNPAFRFCWSAAVDCGRKKVNDHLSDNTLAEYLDGVSTPEEIGAIVKHLTSCAECYLLYVDAARLLLFAKLAE
jgi:hypothetical protein